MRKTPPGVHRESAGDCVPPLWYIIWLGEPHAPGSVVLGRSRRLERHLWHRFFPAGTGTWPKEIRGWVNGVFWLLELHEGRVATSETCTMTETESVRERFHLGRKLDWTPDPGLVLGDHRQLLPRVTLPPWPPGLSSDTLGDSVVVAMSHMLATMTAELGELSEEQVLEAYRQATGYRPDTA